MYNHKIKLIVINIKDLPFFVQRSQYLFCQFANHLNCLQYLVHQYPQMSYTRIQKQDRQRRESQYQNLMFEGADKQVTYHNVCSLTAKVIILCFSSFYFGYCLTSLSTFDSQIVQTVYNVTVQPSLGGIVIGLLPIGGIIGAGTAPLIMGVLTRKQYLLTVNVLAIIVEGILQYNNGIALIVCRVLQGIFVGYYMSIVPIYINELAPRQIIGSFGVFTQLFVLVGVVVSYALSLILNACNAEAFVFYRVMLLFNVILILIQTLLLVIGFIPQSPNSLIKKNRNDEAKNVIRLFTLEAFVQKAYKQKFMQVQVQMGNSQINDSKEERINYSFKAYLLGFQMPFMQQLTGINAIVTQANSIVASIIPSLSPYVSIIINGVQLIATIGAMWSLQKFGRKPINLFGNVGLAIVDIVIGILFIFSGWVGSGYFIFALLIVYMLIYGISIGPSVWMYVPEIIPAKIVPLATMMNWIGCTLCVILTPIAIDANGGNPYPVFFFFGGISFLFFIMNWFLMVQTKGKTTLQIAKLFNKEL